MATFLYIMVREGRRRNQRPQEVVQQLRPEQHQQQQQGWRLAIRLAGGDLGVGRGGHGPAAGRNFTSGGGGGAAGGGGGGGGGQPSLPRLVALTVPPELVGSPFANVLVDIDHNQRIPYGWQRCLDLKTGRIFYKDSLYRVDDDHSDGDMSRNGKNPKLDLRLNLSARRGGSTSGGAGGSRNNNENNNNNDNNNNNGRRGGGNGNSPNRSSSSSSRSPPSSCVSSDTEQGKSGSPDPAAMVLVGCPHCLMYVMLSEQEPRCPKCKSTVLLDFLNDPKHPPGGGSTRRN